MMRCARLEGLTLTVCSRAIGIGALLLMITGCSLRTPGCGNRGVREGIEQDAQTSIGLWSTSQADAQNLPTDVPLTVSGTYETSRTESTRSCSATIKVGSQKDSVEVPIEYEVIITDDAQVMYRWDSTEFGKRVIGTALLSVLSHLKPENDKSVPPPPKANETGNQKRRAKAGRPSDLEQWRDEVTAAINAQAINFAIEGSGSVLLSFDVSASGEISGVSVTKGSGNAGLDATAVHMAEKAGRVRISPNQRATHMSMKLSFL